MAPCFIFGRPQVNPSAAPKNSVIITGSTSGIGYETALLFLKNGYHTHLLGRDIEKLNELKKQFPLLVRIYSCDLTSSLSIQETAQKIILSEGPPATLLINCAGIFERHKNDEDHLEQIWNRQYQVNVLAPVLLVKNFLSYWKTQGNASVVNVSSTLGLRPSYQVSAYSAMKAALIHWTQALALEEGSWGLRANCVAPGIVDTPIHDFHQLPLEEKNKTLQNLGKLQPLGRIGQPEEIARSLFFLAGPDSGWTTGAVLSVDGGINLK